MPVMHQHTSRVLRQERAKIFTIHLGLASFGRTYARHARVVVAMFQSHTWHKICTHYSSVTSKTYKELRMSVGDCVSGFRHMHHLAIIN